jgi:hypothetical protein
MNKYIIGHFIIVCICSFVYAEEPAKLQQIHDLTVALQKGRISEVMAIVQEHRWQAPRIPSKWSVEHRPGSEDQRKIDLAGREFGRKLAVQLDAVAPSLQDLPPGADLNRQAHLLCDLSDWCVSTDGYGNLFLAQRCLDLAAVGLARLTASLDFPLAECEKLAARMTPEWLDVAARARTLNYEAGTNLFAVGGTQTEMEKTWGSGGFLMREKRAGISRPQGQEPGRGFIETPALKANTDFFEDDESRPDALTLVRSWNSKRYARIVNGLELQNVNKALALLKFRSVVGRFPEKLELTAEQLRQRDKEIATYAKMGIRVSKVEEGMDPGEAAFGLAWEHRKTPNPQENNLDASAWQAYSEVKNGQFLDQDTREERAATQTATPDPNAR